MADVADNASPVEEPEGDTVLPTGPEAEALLREARDRLEECIAAESNNRAEALDDLNFLAGDQWPTDAQQARKGRPTLTINMLPAYVRQVVNEQRKTRPAIDVIPGDADASKATADVMQGLIRQIERTSRAATAYDTAFEQEVSCGIGHFRVNTRYVSDQGFEQELIIKRIENPFSVYRDPHSVEPDHSDDRYTFVSDFVDPDDFEEKYGIRPTSRADAGTGDQAAMWFDGERPRVVEYWRVETEEQYLTALASGQVITGKMNKARREELAALGDPVKAERVADVRRVEQYILTFDKAIKKSAWKGIYIPILTSQGLEMNIEGKRKLISLIRYAKDPQRMANYWASAETEAMTLQPKAPIVGASGQFETMKDKWANANVENYAYLEYDSVPGEPPPQRQPPPIFPQGLREGRLQAIADIQSVIGIYPASLGAQSNETSGVAIRQRQQEGDISTFGFIDNHARAIEQCGRVLIDLIPHIYDTARAIRILGTDNQEQLVAINQVFIDANGQEQYHKFDVGKYDVSVRVGPSFESMKQEMVQAMVELSNANPQLMQIAGDIVVSEMDWPRAKEIADRLRQAMQAQQGQPPPEQALLKAQVQVEQIKGDSAKARADADAQIKAMEFKIAEQEYLIKQEEVKIAQFEVAAKATESGQKAEIDKIALGVDREKVNVDMAKVMNERMQLHASMLPRDALGNPLPMPEGQALPMPNPAHDQAMQTMTSLAVEIAQLIKVLAAPRQTHLLTGPDGKPTGSVSQIVTAPTQTVQ